MVRFLLVAAATLAALTMALRPKVKDQSGFALIEMGDVASSCADSYTGYAIVDDSLEKCDNFTSLQMGGSSGGSGGQKAYEEYKCKHLRVHGEMNSNRCVCKPKWSGPICNKYEGCEASLFASVCSKSGCANDGIMAIGSTQMECICKDQWDGRHCDRLACWRLTTKGNDRRYRNVQATKTCECGTHYEGDKCATIKSCEKNGVFGNGVCTCSEGYGGETCERKCATGQVTCSTSSIFSLLLAFPLLSAVFHLLS